MSNKEKENELIKDEVNEGVVDFDQIVKICQEFLDSFSKIVKDREDSK